MMRESQSLLAKVPHKDYQENVYLGFTNIFSRIGNADSTQAYMQKYVDQHDAIERKASDARAEIANIRIENKEAAQHIISLNKEKKKIATIRNFIIMIILLFSAISFLYFNRERLKMKLHQQKVIEEKRLAEAEAEAANDRLTVFTQHMREKTMLIESLQQEMLQKELTEAQVHQIAQLSRHSILTDDDWDRFKNLFENVYPSFFIELRQKAPGISLAEQRIAALSKLQISTKEAANLLGISPNSVNKTRQRLRQRLNLEPDADLEIYFVKQETL
jgi:DNA-binding CsgD family transcriptional regulator